MTKVSQAEDPVVPQVPDLTRALRATFREQ